MLNKVTKLIQDNKIEDALTTILNIEKEYIDNAEYWSLRGFVSLLIQEYATALDCFDNSVRYGSKDGDMYYNRAYAYEQLGLKKEATYSYGLCCRYSNDANIKSDVEKHCSSFSKSLIDIFEETRSTTERAIVLVDSGDNIYTSSTYKDIAPHYVNMNNTVSVVSAPIKHKLQKNSEDSAILHAEKKYNTKNKVTVYKPEALVLSGAIIKDNFVETINTALLETRLVNEFNSNNTVLVLEDSSLSYILEKLTASFSLEYLYDKKSVRKFYDSNNYSEIYHHQKCLTHVSSKISLTECLAEDKQCVLDLVNNENTLKAIQELKLAKYVPLDIKKEIKAQYKKNNTNALLFLLKTACNSLVEAEVYLNKIECPIEKSMYTIYFNELIGRIQSKSDLDRCSNIKTETCLQVLQKVLKSLSTKAYCVIDLFNTLTLDDGLIAKLQSEFKNTIYICGNTALKNSKLSHISIEDLGAHSNIVPLVTWGENYVSEIQQLANFGVSECDVVSYSVLGFEVFNITSEEMESIRKREYLHTVSICKRHASDGNIDAVLRNIPEKYKDRYKINIIDYSEMKQKATMIKLPLLSSVSVGGFGIFSAYPYQGDVANVELWHAGLGVKAIGLLDKKDPNPHQWQSVFENVHKFCVPSDMNKVLYTSLFAIPGHKYELTGLGRNDLLLKSDGRGNLERLLNMSLEGKKVLFNLPTFHYNEKRDRVEGSPELQDNFKVLDFDYNMFNKFLEDNDIICISKPHYAEEETVALKNAARAYSNTVFITNEDLDELNLNLYDILGGADMLITDYSSVAADFIFMNKPIIFVTCDIEEYRESKGFTLEPYDFWSPGPKVNTQAELQSAICDNIKNPALYEPERKTLLPLFYKDLEWGASYKVWDVIDDSFKWIAENRKSL